MKVLLIRPFIAAEKETRLDFSFYAEPLGLQSVAANISDVCDLYMADLYAIRPSRIRTADPPHSNDWKFVGAGPDFLRSLLAAIAPEIVGITCVFASQEISTLVCAETVKSHNPEIKTVAGGIHMSTVYRSLLKRHHCLDAVVVGEGEFTFRDIITAKGSYKTIPGVAFRDNGRVVFNGFREPIGDLDLLQAPLRYKIAHGARGISWYDAGDMDTAGFSGDVDQLVESHIPTGNQNSPANMVLVETSRGCPNRCKYCAGGDILCYSRYRAQSVKKTVDEIEAVVNDTGTGIIGITDSAFNVNRARVIGICREMIRRRLMVEISTGGTLLLERMDLDQLKWLWEAGARRLTFSIETGNEFVARNYLSKKIDFSCVGKTVAQARDIGFDTRGDFMVGFPGETWEQMAATLDFAMSQGFDSAYIGTVQPYPGTPLYRRCVENGFLDEDYDYRKIREYGRGYISTPDWSSSQIGDFIRLARQTLLDNGLLVSEELISLL